MLHQQSVSTAAQRVAGLTVPDLLRGLCIRAFDFVKCGPSKLEGSGAYGVCCTGTCIRPEAAALQNEVAHEHRVDGSWHVVLSPADALLVCNLGWAERGPPIVCQGIGPVGWVFLYAPRDDAERAVVQSILRAAVSWGSMPDKEALGRRRASI